VQKSCRNGTLWLTCVGAGCPTKNDPMHHIPHFWNSKVHPTSASWHQQKEPNRLVTKGRIPQCHCLIATNNQVCKMPQNVQTQPVRRLIRWQQMHQEQKSREERKARSAWTVSAVLVCVSPADESNHTLCTQETPVLMAALPVMKMMHWWNW